MTTNQPRRSLAVLDLPTSVPALIKAGRAIVAAMTGNANFTTPTPPLAQVSGALDSLETTETAAATRAKGTVEARNTAKVGVISELQDVKAYVQDVADANMENAEKIITSAAMSVRKPPTRSKTDFAATPGPTTGTVKLIVRAAARRASYEWQFSVDGGKTWQMAPSTLQAKTILSGLPVGTSVMFRVRAVTRTGEGDWSQIVTLLVN